METIFSYLSSQQIPFLFDAAFFVYCTYILYNVALVHADNIMCSAANKHRGRCTSAPLHNEDEDLSLLSLAVRST